MSNKKALFIDLEKGVRESLENLLKHENWSFLSSSKSEAFDLLSSRTFDLAIYRKTEKNLLKMLQTLQPNLPTFDPEEKDLLLFLQKNSLKDLSLKDLSPPSPVSTDPFWVASSMVMQNLIKDAKKIAKSHASVFITGESGTGKEVIAKIIHLHSYRSQQPFIKVNCAAIPETLIESEFFGYEKGAFTGANNRKEGKFELAHQGTLLLDEVTEIPLFLQSKLLRAIQEKEIERVGGIKPIKVDIRFISTSNRILERAIQEKIFREDLFYRLNVVPLYIPPLRERKEDILSLAEFFLEKFTQEHQKEKKTFSSQAKEALLDYFWPGNVRELSNLIERSVVMDFAPEIEEEHLSLPKTIKTLPEISQNSLPVGISLYEMEKRFILGTLKKENFNKTKTANTLKIHIRTLRNKLKEYEQKDTQIELF